MTTRIAPDDRLASDGVTMFDTEQDLAEGAARAAGNLPPRRKGGKRSRLVPRVLVKSRHRPECKHKADRDYIRCSCPKQLQWNRDGQLFRQSADTDDVLEAERKARELQERFERAAKGEPEPAAPADKQPTIAEVVDRFIASKRASNYTEKSIGKLKLELKQRFVEFCNGQGLVFLTDVKLEHLDAWRSKLKGAANTRRKAQGRVVGFFDWAMRRDFVAKNPALGLDAIEPDPDDPTVALSDEQFAAVLAAIPKVNGRTTDAQRKALRALVLLMRWSGLAIGDAAKVERNRMVPDADGWYNLFLRRAKTGTEVFCSIAPEIAAEVLAVNDHPRYLFWDGIENGEALKNRWGNLFSKLSDTAALKNEHGEVLPFHSHMLRDTFAVSLLNADVAIEDVASLLGHSSIAITQKHYSPWMRSRQLRLTARVKEAYQRTQK